jgi:hypothetical protein
MVDFVINFMLIGLMTYLGMLDFSHPFRSAFLILWVIYSTSHSADVSEVPDSQSKKPH